MLDLSTKRVCLTGGNGFLGRYILAELDSVGCRNIFVPSSKDYDLRTLYGIRSMLQDAKPEIIIHAAAQAGGIGLNQARPAELFFNNAIMGIQLLNESYLAGIEKAVMLGTVCEYPINTPVPFSEKDLWEGYPEGTNASYGLAKKSLLVMGQAYRQQYGFNSIHLLPVNLFGPFDNFNVDSSHVIPALIRKFSEAKKNNASKVTIWGDGSASREFLYVEDCAEAVVKATELYDKGDPINIGTGQEIAIKDLVSLIANLLDFRGDIIYDISKPNGQIRRCLDVTKAYKEFGFRAETDLTAGLIKTINWYLENNG